MYQHRAEALILSSGYNPVERAGIAVPGEKRDPISVSYVLRAQFLCMDEWLRLAVLVEHAVAADCFHANPNHFGIGPAAHEIQKGGDVEGSAEYREIEARPHVSILMGNAIQLAADVQYLATKRLLPDRARAELIVKRLGGHEG